MATGLPVRFVALLVRFTGKVAQSKTKFRQERAQPDSRWHTSFTVCPVFLADMPLAGGVFCSRRRGAGRASAARCALGVSFQEVVPSRRGGEADVAKRQFPHQGREQPCIRMLV
jgi:hypothetical protein